MDKGNAAVTACTDKHSNLSDCLLRRDEGQDLLRSAGISSSEYSRTGCQSCLKFGCIMADGDSDHLNTLDC